MRQKYTYMGCKSDLIFGGKSCASHLSPCRQRVTASSCIRTICELRSVCTNRYTFSKNSDRVKGTFSSALGHGVNWRCYPRLESTYTVLIASRMSQDVTKFAFSMVTTYPKTLSFNLASFGTVAKLHQKGVQASCCESTLISHGCVQADKTSLPVPITSIDNPSAPQC